MNFFRFTVLLPIVMSMCLAFVSCGKKDSSEPPVIPEGEVGELITPDEDSEEADLGSYRFSENGVKLYYEESEYPTELVLTLEKYFRSFADRDYSAYESTVFPDYIEEMEVVLQRDYGYGLENSFETQCINLETNAGGEFTVTRIKIEPSDDDTSEEEFLEEYFSYLDEFFDKDYYSEVKELCDDLHFGIFYVMAKSEEVGETMIASGFHIVFAEKDGKYYVFG